MGAYAGGQAVTERARPVPDGSGHIQTVHLPNAAAGVRIGIGRRSLVGLATAARLTSQRVTCLGEQLG